VVLCVHNRLLKILLGLKKGAVCALTYFYNTEEEIKILLTLWLNSFLVGVPLLVFIRPLSFSFVGLLACCICML